MIDWILKCHPRPGRGTAADRGPNIPRAPGSCEPAYKAIIRTGILGPRSCFASAGMTHGVIGFSEDKTYCVYILASRIGGTLYIGVANNLLRRIREHREGKAGGFTKKYGVTRLVRYETYGEITEAIYREKRLKRRNRAWKIRLIEEKNPDCVDLWPAIENQWGP